MLSLALLLLASTLSGEDPPPAPPAVEIVPMPVEGAEPEDDEADLPPWPDEAPAAASAPEPTAAPAPEPEPPPDPVTLLVTTGAYYSSLGLYLPLTRTGTPSLGEKGELAVYGTLLSRGLVPRFVVLEASGYPMPALGLGLRRWDWLHEHPEWRLVRALTAGFEEPVAISLFVGNVARFAVPGREDVRGRAYAGIVASTGPWHIQDSVAIEDPWAELEVKLKGDRVTAASKLSWSFRLGTKLHASAEVTDVLFVGIRRSRLDADDRSFLANSGVEYRFDLSMRGEPLRHHLVVDKKFPLGRRRVALVLGLGVLWEAAAAYQGGLERSGARTAFLLRPNVQF